MAISNSMRQFDHLDETIQRVLTDPVGKCLTTSMTCMPRRSAKAAKMQEISFKKLIDNISEFVDAAIVDGQMATVSSERWKLFEERVRQYLGVREFSVPSELMAKIHGGSRASEETTKKRDAVEHPESYIQNYVLNKEVFPKDEIRHLLELTLEKVSSKTLNKLHSQLSSLPEMQEVRRLLKKIELVNGRRDFSRDSQRCVELLTTHEEVLCKEDLSYLRAVLSVRALWMGEKRLKDRVNLLCDFCCCLEDFLKDSKISFNSSNICWEALTDRLTVEEFSTISLIDKAFASSSRKELAKIVENGLLDNPVVQKSAIFELLISVNNDINQRMTIVKAAAKNLHYIKNPSPLLNAVDPFFGSKFRYPLPESNLYRSGDKAVLLEQVGFYTRLYESVARKTGHSRLKQSCDFPLYMTSSYLPSLEEVKKEYSAVVLAPELAGQRQEIIRQKIGSMDGGLLSFLKEYMSCVDEDEADKALVRMLFCWINLNENITFSQAREEIRQEVVKIPPSRLKEPPLEKRRSDSDDKVKVATGEVIEARRLSDQAPPAPSRRKSRGKPVPREARKTQEAIEATAASKEDVEGELCKKFSVLSLAGPVLVNQAGRHEVKSEARTCPKSSPKKQKTSQVVEKIEKTAFQIKDIADSKRKVEHAKPQKEERKATEDFHSSIHPVLSEPKGRSVIAPDESSIDDEEGWTLVQYESKHRKSEIQKFLEKTPLHPRVARQFEPGGIAEAYRIQDEAMIRKLELFKQYPGVITALAIKYGIRDCWISKDGKKNPHVVCFGQIESYKKGKEAIYQGAFEDGFMEECSYHHTFKEADFRALLGNTEKMFAVDVPEGAEEEKMVPLPVPQAASSLDFFDCRPERFEITKNGYLIKINDREKQVLYTLIIQPSFLRKGEPSWDYQKLLGKVQELGIIA